MCCACGGGTTYYNSLLSKDFLPKVEQGPTVGGYFEWGFCQAGYYPYTYGWNYCFINEDVASSYRVGSLGIVGYTVILEEIICWAIYYIHRTDAYRYAAHLDSLVDVIF